MRLRKSLSMWLAVLAATAGISYVLAQHAAERVIIREPQNRDLYAAGEEVEIRAMVDGDAVAVGRLVAIHGEVSEDAILAGATVKVLAPVGDDIRAAGRTVRIAAPVGGHVVAAGETVVIESDTSVVDWAWLAGRRVEIAGRIGDQLKAAGEEVVISGETGSDVDIVAENIRIESGAVIRGDLVWHSNQEPEISAGAVIEGEIIEEPVPQKRKRPVQGVFGSILFSMALIITAFVLYLLWPRFSIEAARTVGNEPLKTLGLGLVVSVAVPFGIVLLFATAVGFLLGLISTTVYMLALLSGLLIAIIMIGDSGLRLTGRAENVSPGLRLVSIAVAVIVLLLVGKIPFAGPLAIILVWLTGLGALSLQAHRAYSGRASTA